MALPTGSGSEILCRGSVNELENQTTALDFAGNAETTKNQTTNVVPALNIITLLSLTCYEVENTTTNGIIMTSFNGTNWINILRQPVGQKETFVWNDRIVLYPGDKLAVEALIANDIEIWYSYIKQDWS